MLDSLKSALLEDGALKKPHNSVPVYKLKSARSR